MSLRSFAVSQRQPSHNLIVFVATLLVSLSSASVAMPAGRSLGDGIKAVDLDGDVHRFHDDDQSRAVVLVFLSIDCPISNGYLPGLSRIASRYRRNGVALFGIISDPLVTRSSAIAHRDGFDIPFPVLFDASGELQQQLQPTHTPHAFVLDDQRKVVYEGAIDNTHVKPGTRRQGPATRYLQDAILAVMAEKPVQPASTTPVGCRMEPVGSKSAGDDVTYARDIAPIIDANCVTCHRPDQAAPFSLLTEEDVSRHAQQIVEVTQSRFMPPWKPAAGFGHFRNERRLTDEEVSLLKRWADSGKPAGDPANLPLPREFPTGWQLGKPDLVLTMDEAFEVPADGPDIHQYFVLPTRFRDDRLISAIEFLPGARSVVHHAAFFLDTHGVARRLDARDPDSGYRGFGGPGFLHQGTLRSWLPGMSPRLLPEGTGRLLPKGSDLVVEVHYHCSGKIERDQFQVGIYFAPSTARKLVVELQVLNKTLQIPAGASRHHHQATYQLPVDTLLLDVVPHMHLLGREMKVVAELPTGRIEELVWVKDWDFNWQSQYTYVEPILLPAGTKLVVDAWYDNTADNPLNPNTPPREVVWGPESTDEMDICHFHCTCETLAEIRQLVAHHDRFSVEQGQKMQQR